MMVAELHPEELFDKLASGSLSAVERARLEAHAAVCKACRFELVARLDFLANPDPVHGVVARPKPVGAGDRQPQSLEPGRRRRGPRIAALAAAVMIVVIAGLAAAVSGGLPWDAEGRAIAPAAPSSASPSMNRARLARQRSPSALARAAAPAVSAAPALSLPPPSQRSENAAARVRRIAGSSESSRAAAPTAAATDLEAPNAAALFAAANRARRDGEVAEARRLYRKLQRQFPGSHEANLSQVTLATLQLDSSHPAQALADFDRYLSRGGQALEAEALVGRALSLRALGKREAEAAAWREVLRKYPRSGYAKRAARELAALDRFE